MARNQIVGGNFTNIDGSPVVLGYLKIQLTRDAQIIGTNSTQISGKNIAIVPLDSNGNISGTILIWPNDQMSPSGLQYFFRVYTAAGQLVSGPYLLTIPSSPSPYTLP